MTKHTPTPWAVEDNCLGVYPISAKQGPLTVHPAKAFGEEDAAFIVKAVNNHDALVLLLHQAKAYLVIDQLSPAVHSFEIEKRVAYRNHIVEQISAILGAVVSSPSGSDK